MKVRTRIGSWNVRTLSETHRLAQLCIEFNVYGLLHLGVSEIRWPSVEKHKRPDGLTLSYSGKPDTLLRTSGVEFLMTKNASSALMTWKPFSDLTSNVMPQQTLLILKARMGSTIQLIRQLVRLTEVI